MEAEKIQHVRPSDEEIAKIIESIPKLKIVINKGFERFHLSKRAWDDLEKRGFDIQKHLRNQEKIPRHDPKFVEMVEDLKERASTNGSKLVVVEIPEALKDIYVVERSDGQEFVVCPLEMWTLDHAETLRPENIQEWRHKLKSMYFTTNYLIQKMDAAYARPNYDDE